MIWSAIARASGSPVAKLTAMENPRSLANFAIAAPMPRLAPVTIRVPLLACTVMESNLPDHCSKNAFVPSVQSEG
jgi:hypothetical protein